MSPLPALAGDTERFRELIRGWLGLDHEDARLGSLAEVLRDRLAATGARDLDAYARIAGSGDELRALAERLTVGETYFFRNPDHFRALAEHVLPDRIRHNAASRRLRILSLGCATGEEPYSIAILLRERWPELESWDVELVGVDVNRASLIRAAAARYSAWALRATPAELVARWFAVEGRDHVLDRRARSMVRFVEHNLADGLAPWWGNVRWDVVLCRNILMYLMPALSASVITRLGQALAPDGYLFLGHAESLRGRAGGFALRHTHDTFYYQASADDDGYVTAAATPPQVVELGPPTGDGLAWMDAIDRASRRIEALSQRDPGDVVAVAEPVPRSPGQSAYERALALFEQELVDDALAELDAAPPDPATQADALLLRAILCTNRGRLADAEAACAELLAGAAPDPGAHYLMALCRESDGDALAAATHDRAAIAIDPGFAMARLHLGRLHRRTGDDRAARDELSRALALLERDDAARLALFGGGFRRDALMALCRSELAACGGNR